MYRLEKWKLVVSVFIDIDFMSDRITLVKDRFFIGNTHNWKSLFGPSLDSQSRINARFVAGVVVVVGWPVLSF